MKTLLLVCISFLLCTLSMAQVGIGNTDPNASLDISASNSTSPLNTDGLLIPRIDDFPSTNPGVDQDGMLVFITGNGTPTKGFYYWNQGTGWTTVDGASSDADWYQTGTTNVPTSITDNIFTNGTVGIQSGNLVGLLNMDRNFGSNPGSFIYNTATGVANIGGTMRGLHNNFSGSATTPSAGVRNEMTQISNSTQYGVDNSFSGTGPLANRVGMYNFYSAGGGTMYGVQNVFPGAFTLNGTIKGMFNNILTNGGGSYYGVENVITGSGNGLRYGVKNELGGSGTGDRHGIRNDISGAGSGAHYGIRNELTGTGTGTQYGSFNYLNITSGSATKYGVYSRILTSSSGTHYGVYSDARSTSGYAGYFLGRMSLGDTSFNRYLMPAADGSSGQVMTTDGSGNVTFQDIVGDGTGSDDQQIDTFSFDTGTNVLTLELEDDAQPTQTVDLSTLATTDSDWLTIVGSNTPTSVNDNIYTAGSVSIGTTTNLGDFNISHNESADGSADIVQHNAVGNSGDDDKTIIYNAFNSANNGNNTAVHNELIGNGNGLYIGVSNRTYAGSGTTGEFRGMSNSFTNNTDGNFYGMFNSLSGSGDGEKYGVYNLISSSGSGTKYGTYTNILTSSGGTHYGIYSDVQKSGSYAGYFLGTVSIGTSSGNSYEMPASRGVNGDIMQTNGTGDISWVDPSTVFTDTDTDEQQIDTFSFNSGSNVLTLEIENDGQAAQTVDLSSLQNTDVDWYETGTTNAPDAITDNITTQGNVSITNGTLDVTSPANASGGINVSKNITNTTSFTYTNITASATVNGSSNAELYDATFVGNGNGSKTGYNTSFAGTGSGANTAIRNNFNNNNGTNQVGIQNTFNNTSTNTKTGLLNDLDNNAQNGIVYGVHNTIEGGLGTSYGMRTYIENGSGTKYGTYSHLVNGTGNRYGSYALIEGTGTGIEYGTYTDVEDITNGYAAYFIGRTSLGNTLANRYIMPSVDGTNGQVMTTNGAGVVSFQDVTSNDTQNTLDQAYDEGGAGAGRTILATDGAVTIAGSDGIDITGALGGGQDITNGTGPRMYFNPKKAAIRAGNVDASQWDNANVGFYSTGFGLNTTASGVVALAGGTGTTASGARAVAFGIATTASGDGAMTIGSGTVASDSETFAGGFNATASGARAFSFGNATIASSENAVAFGGSSTASNNNTFAAGFNAIASGSSAVALGLHGQAPSWGEVTVGAYATTYTPNSSTSWDMDDRIFTVGNGVSAATRSNALTIYKDGEVNINDAYSLPTADGTSGQVMTTDGAGNVTFQDITTKARARIIMAASQTETGSGITKVNFDTEDFDIGSNFNIATDEFEVPADGVYRVHTKISINTSTATGTFDVRIRVDGTQVRRTAFDHTGAGAVIRQCTSLLNLTAGQTIDVAFLRPSPGATINSNGALSYFEIEQL